MVICTVQYVLYVLYASALADSSTGVEISTFVNIVAQTFKCNF